MYCKGKPLQSNENEAFKNMKNNKHCLLLKVGQVFLQTFRRYHYCLNHVLRYLDEEHRCLLLGLSSCEKDTAAVAERLLLSFSYETFQFFSALFIASHYKDNNTVTNGVRLVIS